MRTTLDISEDFYSIQGEGVTSGYPAYFIRLRNCNLMCGGPGGSLMKSGKATWWCDTEAVWKKGVTRDFNYLRNRWIDQDIIDWVATGRVHLIWTGGEPTLPRHQESIVAFLEWFRNDSQNQVLAQTSEAGTFTLYNEIETNGTIYIDDPLFNQLDQINCSVKLANSGMLGSKRIVPASLKRIMEHPNYWFKFVISTENDLKEIIRDFVEPFDIPAERILMMPGLDSREKFYERTLFCLEMAKQYGFIGLTRLHVAGWDKTTGV